MNESRSQFIILLFSWASYALFAWGYALLSNGRFLPTLGVLITLRLFFSTIEALVSALAWRSYGKKRTVENNLTLLRANKFPKRQFPHDDFLNYLARIENDTSYSQQIKEAAKQWGQALAISEGSGILLGMRMHAAAEEALNIYSPKNEVN